MTLTPSYGEVRSPREAPRAWWRRTARPAVPAAARGARRSRISLAPPELRPRFVERGDRGLTFEEDVFQRIGHAPGGLFVANGEAHAMGCGGERRVHHRSRRSIVRRTRAAVTVQPKIAWRYCENLRVPSLTNLRFYSVVSRMDVRGVPFVRLNGKRGRKL